MNQLQIAAIHDLVNKTYTFDTLIQYSQTIPKPYPPVFYFVYLCRLYSQRKKAQTVQQQQQLNKVINACEDSFADIIHELKSIVWDDHLVNGITKCVILNSNLFRNHQRQLQELCVTKYSNLFAVLQFAKQNNVAVLISNTIEQLVDAFYVMVSQIDTSKDLTALHAHWQETLLTEEFRSILQLNSKAKHSLVFSLVNISEFQITSFKETLTCILNLLSAQLSFIKEDIVLDIQIEKILKIVKDTLLMNDGRVELNKLLIEKRITLTPDAYEELIHFIREQALKILLNLVQSPFAEQLIQNSFSEVLLKFIDRQSEGFEEVLGQLIMSMQRANFLTTRLEIQLQLRIITTLENEFPKFMKNMHSYTKTERLQIQVTKRPPKSKDIQLGFSSNDQLNKQKVRKLRNSFRVQFQTLSNICVSNLKSGHSLEVTKKLYQLLFMICSFPHDHLLLYSGTDVIQTLLHLCRVVLHHYNELEICVLQPIKYFIEFLVNSEAFQLDLNLQEQCNGFIELIDFIYTKKKTLIVDNYVSIQKSLNDQFQKMQQLYQSTNSDEQYYSCKDQQLDQSENLQAQIRRTKSLVGEEESNSKPKNVDEDSKKVEEEMFYSINVIESNKSAPPQPIKTVQFVPVDDQDFEIPKAIFD